MLLPTVKIDKFKNFKSTHSDFKYPDHLSNKDHLVSYPGDFDYCFNSRGFRDSEWPTDLNELKNAIWCFGDSNTVGIGNPLEHSWVNILQNKSNQRCINVSLGGGSNDWIGPQVEQVINEVNPKNIVIQWTFFHRGEDKTINDVFDRQQKIRYIEINDQINNFYTNFNKTLNGKNIIHSMVPLNYTSCWDRVAGPDWPKQPRSKSELDAVPQWILNEIINDLKCYDNLVDDLEKLPFLNVCKELNIIPLDQIDLSRDSAHYGLITANKFVNQILTKIK